MDKKNNTVVIRITEEQEEMLRFFSEKSGLDRSSVIRACLNIMIEKYRNANE